MKFIGEPWELLPNLGPPTAFQPQWTGKGYKHYVFQSSPVSHVIAPDGRQHQMINVRPEDAHLPVERGLLGYIKDTGYNPAQFDIPDHQTAWDALSEQFGFPDTRPASMARSLPTDASRFSTGDINPVTGRWPSSLPRPRGY